MSGSKRVRGEEAELSGLRTPDAKRLKKDKRKEKEEVKEKKKTRSTIETPKSDSSSSSSLSTRPHRSDPVSLLRSWLSASYVEVPLPDFSNSSDWVADALQLSSVRRIRMEKLPAVRVSPVDGFEVRTINGSVTKLKHKGTSVKDLTKIRIALFARSNQRSQVCVKDGYVLFFSKVQRVGDHEWSSETTSLRCKPSSVERIDQYNLCLQSLCETVLRKGVIGSRAFTLFFERIVRFATLLDASTDKTRDHVLELPNAEQIDVHILNLPSEALGVQSQKEFLLSLSSALQEDKSISELIQGSLKLDGYNQARYLSKCTVFRLPLPYAPNRRYFNGDNVEIIATTLRDVEDDHELILGGFQPPPKMIEDMNLSCLVYVASNVVKTRTQGRNATFREMEFERTPAAMMKKLAQHQVNSQSAASTSREKSKTGIESPSHSSGEEDENEVIL